MSKSQAYSTSTSEYRTYSTKGTFDDIKDFESMKTEMLPSKYGSLVHNNGIGSNANKEYYYEYKEEKNPKGTYDKKDLHTVEQYEFQSTPKNYVTHTYTESFPAITSTPHRTTTTTKTDISHNIDELDSLLDDLQRDRERKQYKSGYTSDTMESSSFDYRAASTPVKSSGYSSLSRVEKNTEYIPAPTVTREINKEVMKNEYSESRLVPLENNSTRSYNYSSSSSNVPMKKVTTTVKTYTYEVPIDQDPTLYPIPGSTPPSNSAITTTEKYVDRNYQHSENTDHRTYTNTEINEIGDRDRRGQYPRINTRTTTHYPAPINQSVTRTVQTMNEYNNSDVRPYTGHPPVPLNETGPTSYKYSQSNYTYSTIDGIGDPVPSGLPGGNTPPFPSSPVPFGRTESPAPRVQQPPKKLDELLADFPGHEQYNSSHDGVRHRSNGYAKESVRVHEQSSRAHEVNAVAKQPPSKNISGPAVYYPPGHEMFQKKEEAMAYQQAGGQMKAAKSKYMYESESGSKSKSSTKVQAVPLCLPLCCAMPCTIL